MASGVRALPGALAIAVALSACGGSGSSAPRPAPTASGGPTAISAVRTARGSEQVAFATLRSHVLAAQFARPGQGALIPAAVAPPTCDPRGSGTATATTTDLAQQFYYTTVVFYPAGDTACAASPNVVGVFSYPNPATTPFPLVATGYLAGWAPANDPYYLPGTPKEFDQVTLTVNNAVDGSVGLSMTITGSDGLNDQTLFPQRPPAGTFPNTFPVSAAKTISGFSTGNYALVTSVALQEAAFQISSTAVAQPSTFYAGTQQVDVTGAPVNSQATTVGTLVGQDQATSTVTPTGPASFRLAGTVAPSYAFATAYPVPLVGYPPASGSALFAFDPASPLLTVRAGPVNFGAAQQLDTGTYSYNGAGTAVDEKIVDSTNGVAVEITSASPGYALTITDLLSGKPMTLPAVVPIDALGNSAPYTFVVDGTSGLVSQFVVLE